MAFGSRHGHLDGVTGNSDEISYVSRFPPGSTIVPVQVPGSSFCAFRRAVEAMNKATSSMIQWFERFMVLFQQRGKWPESGLRSR